jgi:hypothetical protein
VESIAGDEAAAAELDRLARLMEQQAILEKVQHIHLRHKISPFLTKKNSQKFIFGYIRSVPVSVADPDPGSGIRCLFDPWIRDPGSGMGFFRIPDPGSQDHILKSFLTIFLVKSYIIL